MWWAFRSARRMRDVHNLTSALSSCIHFHKEIQSLKCVLFSLDEDTFNPAISEISGANVPAFDLQKPEHFGSESSVKVFSALHYLTSIFSGSLVLVPLDRYPSRGLVVLACLPFSFHWHLPLSHWALLVLVAPTLFSVRALIHPPADRKYAQGFVF